MNKELDEKLCKDFPEIFRDRHGDMRTTAMCWGFECDDGWEPVIRFICDSLMGDVHRLRDKIAHIEETLSEEDKSHWNDWMKSSYSQEKLDERKAELLVAIEQIPIAVQVKEKFGGLRFYASGADEKQQDVIHYGEQLSYRVCEKCGTMKNVMAYACGWYKTLCADHANEYYGAHVAQEERDYQRSKQ